MKYNYRVGMYKVEDYFMPASNDIPAGTFTTTIKQLKMNGALCDITYSNHPKYNRQNEFKGYQQLAEHRWLNSTQIELPEELFTL